MYVTKLGFENFRNLENGAIYPAQGINVLYGENAQGKTNLLEALWLFTGGHSFRGAKDAELARIDSEKGGHTSYTKLLLQFSSRERAQEAILNVQNGRRSSVLNGVARKTGTALVGKICAVIFSPEHLLLVKEGPARRRGFIDGAICQIKPSYAKALSVYNRSLLQRNALLKDVLRHPELLDTMEVWNRRLSKFGAQIMAERQWYTRLLREKIDGIYRGISQNREEIRLSYSFSLKIAEGFTEQEAEHGFFQALQKSEKSDIRAGFTTNGPHRDDLEIHINSISARMYGSQGQQRSAVLSMKLAEAELLAEATGEAPLILLDDVMSELDPGRQDYLLNHLHNRQVFITCCAPESVHLLEAGRKFLVKNGNIVQQDI